jgi:hypothetical protein
VLDSVPSWTYDAGPLGTAVALGDINGDRRPDLVIGYSGDPSIVVFYAAAPCPADITGGGGCPDGNVDSMDFLMLIGQWASPCVGSCYADITGPGGDPDGNVDSSDFLVLIAQWGSPGSCSP